VGSGGTLEYDAAWRPVCWRFAGLLLRTNDRTKAQSALLLLAGLAGVLLGHLWDSISDHQKDLELLLRPGAGGYSALLLGFFYLVIDVWKCQKWCQPFVWIGMNSITVYMANNIINFDRLGLRFAAATVKKFLDATVTTGFGDLVVALVAWVWDSALSFSLSQKNLPAVVGLSCTRSANLTSSSRRKESLESLLISWEK